MFVYENYVIKKVPFSFFSANARIYKNLL